MAAPPRENWLRDHSKWFDWILERAEIYDYGRYPIKGMGVWMPYGFQLRSRILGIVRELHDRRGHEEVLFPMLIPEHLLRKEAEHVRGFEDEVYWVTHGGLEELDVKLALRPTSETSITFLESLWLKSYKQLPKKYYQVVSVFRYETKATRPMIRLREVTTFKEAHTVHESYEDAERQVIEAIEIYKELFDSLGIPYLISRRPDWDKFAGALYTIAFDTIMPDGRALQIGTVHNLGQTFTKAFDFKIQLRDQSLDYPWQDSYGISDRVVATVISIHGDDHGAVLPPNISPVQVVIIPIPLGGEEERSEVLRESRRILGILEEGGFRARVDDREDVRPGEKYYDWEAKGVPLRLEIGLRELKSGKVTIVKRNTLERIEASVEGLASRVGELLEELHKELREEAWKFMASRVKRTTSLEEARQWVEGRMGVVEMPWDGREECAHEVEESLGAKSLGTPWPMEAASGERCPVCGAEAVAWMRYSRTY